MWLQFRANFAGRYIEMRMRLVDLSMRTEGRKAFSKRIRRCSVDGRKRYENDKTAPFSFENGLVWTGPESFGRVKFSSLKYIQLQTNK